MHEVDTLSLQPERQIGVLPGRVEHFSKGPFAKPSQRKAIRDGRIVEDNVVMARRDTFQAFHQLLSRVADARLLLENEPHVEGNAHGVCLMFSLFHPPPWPPAQGRVISKSSS